MPEKSGKLLHLESARGLAAFAVVLSHLVNLFALPLHSPDWSKLNGYPLVVRLFALPPLRIVYDGEAAVLLFFVLSGIVLSYSFFKSGRCETLTSAAIRRYFRLVIPIGFSVLVVYTFMRLGLFWNNAQSAELIGQKWGKSFFNTTTPSFLGALKEGYFGVFFSFDSEHTYNGILWTMPIELAGSFFVFCFLALFGQLKRRWLVYGIVLAGLLVLRQIYFVDFLLGIMVCDYYIDRERAAVTLLPFPRWIKFLMLGAGICLASCSAAGPWTLPGGSTFLLRAPLHIASVGVTLILAACLFSNRLKRVLHGSIFIFLGRLSFSLYLIHTVIIFSVTTRLYCFLRSDERMTHFLSASIASLSGIAGSLLAAWLMYLWVDRPAVLIGKLIAEKVFGVPANRKQLSTESAIGEQAKI